MRAELEGESIGQVPVLHHQSNPPIHYRAARASERSSTIASRTLLPSRKLVKSIRHGSPRWTGRACEGGSLPGFTSTQYCPECCSLCLFERKISSYFCRWLGLLHGFSTAAMYSTSNILQLQISVLTEEFMGLWTQEALQYRKSKYPKVVTIGIQV